METYTPTLIVFQSSFYPICFLLNHLSSLNSDVLKFTLLTWLHVVLKTVK